MKTLEKNVLEVFPHAEPGEQFLSELIERLEKEEGFDINKTLLGLSICPDETNASVFTLKKYFPYFFFLGGLSGYPFTGKTGMSAFASHVPEGGNALILYAPHIGITRSHSGVGSIIRRDQSNETTCCGAIISILDKFQNNMEAEYDNDDFQIEKVYNYLKPHSAEILDSEIPKLDITRLVYQKIKNKIQEYSLNIKEDYKLNKVALVGGIMINTDHGYSDFFEMIDYDIL